MDDPTKQRISEHWAQRTEGAKPSRINWWESEMVRQHINRLVSGSTSAAPGRGLLERAKQLSGGRRYLLGVSVGCGIASKELRLMELGLVERFVLFELSEARIERGKEMAQKKGLLDRVEFRSDDAFKAFSGPSFDFVHWDNSLHHMFDVMDAVRWSEQVLKPGGMFYMFDFVGPTRWQWTDKSLDLIERVRGMLPERMLRDPWYPERRDTPLLKTRVDRKTPARIMRDDPSEAADCGRILDALAKYFPTAEVKRVGGVIFHLGLSHVYHNIDESQPDDRAILSLLLMLDELCLEVPGIECHYATALATKPG